MYYTNGNDEGAYYDIQTIANRWYHDNIENNDNYKNIVTTGIYCQAAKVRNSSTDAPKTLPLITEYIPSYSCPEDDGSEIEIAKKLTLQVGLATIDEILMAGHKLGSGNDKARTYFYCGSRCRFWTISPAGFFSKTAKVWHMYNANNSSVEVDRNTDAPGLRPVINLKSTTMAHKETIDGITYYVVDQPE